MLQLIDSLAIGGAERVATNLALALRGDRWRSSLVATRDSGPLEHQLVGRTEYWLLGRRRRFDGRAFRRMRSILLRERVALLHAHASSIFFGVLASLGTATKVVWHDHFGRLETESRPAWLYRPFVRRTRAVITVDPRLSEWSVGKLGVPPGRVSYLENFVVPEVAEPADRLAGEAGCRVVCVANFRPQKDHPMLLRAWARVATKCPLARLFLVGSGVFEEMEEQVARAGLTDSVEILGERSDVGAVLAACDIGVLTSNSEGLPIALLEYGLAGLAVVCTEVGRCGEVLDAGRVGRLCEPGDDRAVASQLIALLADESTRLSLGSALRERVLERHGVAQGVARIEAVYAEVLRST